jgi:hypothetical protein
MARKKRIRASPSTSPSHSPSPLPSSSPTPPSPNETKQQPPRTTNPPAVSAAVTATNLRHQVGIEAAAARVRARGGLGAVYTNAQVALSLAHELIDWVIMDVALDVHRHQYLQTVDCPAILQAVKPIDSSSIPTNSSSPSSLHAPADDPLPPVPRSDGRQGAAPAPSGLLHSDKNVNVECSVCASSIAAARYAQHLEKCLGRGGRSSSRAASARLKASAERAEKEAAAEIDEPAIPRKRRLSSLTEPSPPGSGGISGSYGHSSIKAEDGMHVHLPPLP